MRTKLAAALVLIVTACGPQAGLKADEPTSTTVAKPTSTTPPPETNDQLDVITSPTDDGEFPDDLLVSCGGGAFPIGDLDDIRPLAEADPGGVAEAIEAFLSSGEGESWPQEGWQVLSATDSVMQLVVDHDGRLAFMTVSNDGSGWEWSGSSIAGEECRLEFVVPEHLNAVDWRPDPDGGAIGAETTQIPVILNERECVSGQEIGDRLVGPQIVMTDDTVFVAFAAEKPEGDAFDCQGNPDMSYLLELPEPMADRELMEGLEIGASLEDYMD